MWNTAKEMLRGKFLGLNANVRRKTHNHLASTLGISKI